MAERTDIRVADVGKNTNAVANTTDTTEIVAAPGAGSRLRLWGYEFCFSTSVTPLGAKAHGMIRGNPGNSKRIDTWLNSDATGVYFIWVPGGVPCTENAQLHVIDRCSIASVGIIHRCWYTVETI